MCCNLECVWGFLLSVQLPLQRQTSLYSIHSYRTVWVFNRVPKGIIRWNVSLISICLLYNLNDSTSEHKAFHIFWYMNKNTVQFIPYFETGTIWIPCWNLSNARVLEGTLVDAEHVFSLAENRWFVNINYIDGNFGSLQQVWSLVICFCRHCALVHVYTKSVRLYFFIVKRL